MNYYDKPFRYLFLKKYINPNHYKFKNKGHRIYYFIKNVLFDLDNYVSQNLPWRELIKRQTNSGKGKFRMIPKEDVEAPFHSYN